MSDRKYRQRGYMDDERDRQPRGERPRPDAPRPPMEPRHLRDPKKPNMPGFREVVRCVRCGTLVSEGVLWGSTCGKCKADLHACVQCGSFSPGSRFECMQPVTARITPKDTRNECKLFVARTTVERETGSVRQSDARSAFEDLFK